MRDLIDREETVSRMIGTAELIEYEPLKQALMNFALQIRDNKAGFPTVDKGYDMGYQDGSEDGLNGIRPQGKWIAIKPYNHKTFCSICHQETWEYEYHNFCPNCGADMREETANND